MSYTKSRAESCADEIARLEAEIKRLNDHLKGLRQQRDRARDRLRSLMERSGRKKVGNYTLARLKPRKASARAPRKKKADKKRDGIRLLREAGIPDPNSFYNQFLQTQRATLPLSETT